MTSPETLHEIEETFDTPKNFRPIARTASGLLLTRCVDRRLVDIGGAVRMPGNSEGPATIAVMRNRANSLQDGIQLVARMGLRLGMHGKTCAYDHNIPALLRLIANQNSRVMELYGQLGEQVNAQLPAERRVQFDKHLVVGGAERAFARLRDHRPDEIIDYVANIEGSEVVLPGDPREEAAAFIVTTDPSDMVIDTAVAPDGRYYLDSSVKAVTQSNMPDEYLPEAMALTAATAVLVAHAHDLPIVTVAGTPGNREFAVLSGAL